MAYDDVLLKMGEFGKYQQKIYLLLCLPVILCAIHKLAGIFLNAEMHTRCLLPWEDENATFYLDDNIMNANYPPDKIYEFAQCHRRSKLAINASSNNAEIISCQKFVFDTSTYKSTTTSEWNLVCDQKWLRTVGDSLFMIGVMIGSITFGAMSDKYGRKPTFFLSLVIQLVAGILVAVAPGFILYVIFRMIVGASASGVFLVAYVTALEMVGPTKRLTAGVGCQLFFTTGYLLLGSVAFFVTDWRYLQIVLTLPSIVFLVYWWFIPESARWLFSNGKDQQAKEILQGAAHTNGVQLSPDALNDLLKKNNDNTSVVKKAFVLDLIRNAYLRKKCMILFFNWIVNSNTYYGLSLSSTNFGNNDHLNFLISGLVEIPAYTFLIFTLNRWGRKKILCGSMIVSGVSLIATVFFPSGHWGIIMLAMIGKLTITASYGTIYIFTAEQFPTVVRNVGMGACSTFAKLGGAVAPFVRDLSKIWKPFPLIIFGVSALIGGLLSLLLPETLNKKLPDTIQDVEVFKLQDEELKVKQRKNHRKPMQNNVHELNNLETIS